MPDGVESHSSARDEGLQIGDWTVEPALNQLAAAGRSVKVEPKAMALLTYLADRPGEVVARDALLAAVWPGVVVGDDSLTQAVIKLRKALGDTAESPAYIQTIPKRGYRLVARVVRPAMTDGHFGDRASNSPALRVTGKRRVVFLAIAGTAVLLLVAAAVWWVLEVAVDRASSDPSATARTEAVRAAQPTVTVAPFEALGDDAEAALLARGITADLVTDLSKVFGLSVISAIPHATRSDARVHPEAPGYLVSGTVQRLDGALRLQVHLADAQTGKQLWAERFDRTVSALFVMQEELVGKILRVLPAKVSEAELRRVAQHHTRNLEAYDHFQRGQAALLVRQQAENETARRMFQRAIELDATFARAYAALALTYAADYRNYWTKDGPGALDRAFELARTAHEINPDVRETYWVLAFVHLERGQHKQALDYLETAVRLYPSFADAYALMGGINVYIGQPASGLSLLRTAMRLNPDGGYLYFLILGRAYFGLGDLDQARLNLEHALLRNPVNVEARVYLAALHVMAGDKATAEWQAEEIRAVQPDFSRPAWLATHPLTDVKVRNQLAQALGQIGL